MKLHEYQSKQLFRQAGIPVPESNAVTSLDDVEEAYNKLGTDRVVVKVQAHAGGRGKAGGVKIVDNRGDAKAFAEQFLGKKLATKQTGPEGQTVSAILLEAPSSIATEIYASIVIDRAIGLPTLIVCAEGGVEIEEVAERTPEKIIKESYDPGTGLQGYQARRIFLQLGLDKSLMNSFASLLIKLARLFVDRDCSMAEINPLVITEDNQVLALDAKITIDDNALYRQKDIAEMRDFTQEDPREVEAANYDLSYIGLDGDIGCMVNGAGLAMATMDIVKFYGGDPANFLDVGGGATAEKVAAAFKIILTDENVKAIMVNIFGGIMQCDVIAEGVIAAVNEISLSVPLVVRLEGTNVERGRQLLEESGLPLETATSLAEAAEKAVKLAKGAA
ncbi:MAG: ADP-forming succinate--CoA ligase subunit beta [Planctomycetota bacterium]|jgi:succinyl-CoA synthetase beta subunit|nr:ADP-forming succinate--CoA ligase subunit beta [Planctomycetota bacterium]MDP6502475.1 ADP-forming succinate--CoA ligase subunit beta [Planctomycetota bacterium]